MFGCKRAYASYLFALFLSMCDVDGKIGTVKATGEGSRVAQLKLLYDVCADVGRGGGSQGYGLRSSDAFQRSAQAQVVGPEIMSPGGDAMRFVNGEERNLRAAQGFDEMITAEAFRRNVDELERAAT